MSRFTNEPKKPTLLALVSTPPQEPVTTPPEPFRPVDASLEDLKDIFVTSRKVVVITTMRESIYDQLQEFEGGVSRFYETAIRTFNGPTTKLIEAANRFELNRKGNKTEGRCNVSGRIAPDLHKKTMEVLEQARVAKVKRISHSKIIGGYTQLLLDTLSGSAS